MPLKLVFIGRLEDVAGASERQVQTVESLDALLAALEPDLAVALRDERIKVAINGAMTNRLVTVGLQDGDEIAFLPPVSGG